MSKLNLVVSIDSKNFTVLWNETWAIITDDVVIPNMKNASANISNFLSETLFWFIEQKTWNYDFSNLASVTPNPAAVNYMSGLMTSMINTWGYQMFQWWNLFFNYDIAITSYTQYGTTTSKTTNGSETKNFKHQNSKAESKKFNENENENENKNSYFNEMVKSGDSTQNITNPQQLNDVLNSSNDSNNSLSFSNFSTDVNANTFSASNRANVDNEGASRERQRNNSENVNNVENQNGNENNTNNQSENETSCNTLDIWGRFYEWITEKNLPLRILEWLENYTKNARRQVYDLVYFKNTSWGWF